MKLSRYFCLIFLVVSLSLAASVPAAAKDKWISLHTKSFLIVSNGSSDDTRRLAFKLEQFRAIFAKLTKTENSSPVPITVVAFKNDGSFKPFKPLYNGKPANVAGYFQRGEDENMIALDMSSGDEYPLQVIFHEYTHLLTAYSPRPWPLWLNEGIAEVYSTFDVQGKEVVFGKPLSNHVYLLRDNKFVPLQALFNVQHDSPVYNERDKQSIFYAESWALAHYMMFGDKSAHHDQLVQFVRLYEQGMDMEHAFTQAFKTDFATLEKTLRQYIGNNSYSGMRYTLDSTEGDKNAVEQPLTDAEVQYYLGDLLFHTNRLDEAENLFKQAQTLDAALPGPHEGLGMVAMRRNQYDTAVGQFKEAIAHGSKNYLAHYYYGEAMLRQSMNEGRSSGLPAEESKTIITELKTSISLMPSFAQAYNQLAFAQMMAGGDLKEALASSQAALRLEPQNPGFALILAQIQMRMRDYATAKKTLTPVLASDDPGLKQSAQSIMGYIDNYLQMDNPSASSGSSARTAITGSSAEASGGEPSQPPRLKRHDIDDDKDSSIQPEVGNEPKETDAGKPTIKPEGTQAMNGTLIGMECGNGLVLVFRSEGKLLRFAVSNPNALQFFTQDPQLSPQIQCGKMNYAAFIHYKPMADKNGQYAGDAVAVEIKKQPK